MSCLTTVCVAASRIEDRYPDAQGLGLGLGPVHPTPHAWRDGVEHDPRVLAESAQDTGQQTSGQAASWPPGRSILAPAYFAQTCSSTPRMFWPSTFAMSSSE